MEELVQHDSFPFRPRDRFLVRSTGTGRLFDMGLVPDHKTPHSPKPAVGNRRVFRLTGNGSFEDEYTLSEMTLWFFDHTPPLTGGVVVLRGIVKGEQKLYECTVTGSGSV